MRSMQWQLGILGTITAFAYRHRKTKKNLCRGGRSQDLPNTDFQPAVRHLKRKQQCIHSATNTHKMTTIHTRHLTIQHVQKVTNPKLRKYCIQFPVFFPTHTVLTLSPQPCTSHHFAAHINNSHKVSFLLPSLFKIFFSPSKRISIEYLHQVNIFLFTPFRISHIQRYFSKY